MPIEPIEPTLPAPNSSSIYVTALRNAGVAADAAHEAALNADYPRAAAMAQLSSAYSDFASLYRT